MSFVAEPIPECPITGRRYKPANISRCSLTMAHAVAHIYCQWQASQFTHRQLEELLKEIFGGLKIPRDLQPNRLRGRGHVTFAHGGPGYTLVPPGRKYRLTLHSVRYLHKSTEYVSGDDGLISAHNFLKQRERG